jgi:hypothetical protein
MSLPKAIWKKRRVSGSGSKASTNPKGHKERNYRKIHEIAEMHSLESFYEENLAELALARMVERGLEDSRQGRVISNDTMEMRILEWINP